MFNRKKILLNNFIFLSITLFAQNNEIFNGGEGSGFSQFSISQTNANYNNAIFSGGIKSGETVDCHIQSNPIYTEYNNAIFNGGIKSGETVVCHAQSDAIYNNFIFNGGVKSGYDVFCSNINLESGSEGFKNNLSLWLKADDGVVGNPINSWLDKSGREMHANKNSGAPTKINSSTNYNPTVYFDGNDGFYTDSILIEQLFIVFKPNIEDNDNSDFQILGRKNNLDQNSARVLGFGNKNVNSSNDGSAFASPDKIRINGKNNATLSNTSFNIISVDVGNKVGVKDVYSIGKKSPGTNYSNLNGEIAEIISYSHKKTGVEFAKIESYLSIKYGITLNNTDGGANGNYYSNSGDTIWKANDNYHFDVIGIGKDTLYHLNQKQSKTNDGKFIVFIDKLANTNLNNIGNIENNQSYIMVGHNNGVLQTAGTTKNEKPLEIKNRLDREWKITNTNFDNNFSLEIEWDSTGTFDLSHVRLLVDDDGDFTNALVYGPQDGLVFRLGSIIVEDINSSFIPKGSTKYVTLGSIDELTVLPVELLYFKAEKNEKSVNLKWETASEINSDYFEILHSTDNINFKSIGKLNAVGNSNIINRYSVIDYNPVTGVNYYKLREYDLEGKLQDYKTIFVNFEFTPELYDFVFYPNPNNYNGTIFLKTNYIGEINLHILDAVGKIIIKEKINVFNQDNNVIKNLNLTPGFYPFVISSPNNDFTSKTFKLIIQ